MQINGSVSVSRSPQTFSEKFSKTRTPSLRKRLQALIIILMTLSALNCPTALAVSPEIAESGSESDDNAALNTEAAPLAAV